MFELEFILAKKQTSSGSKLRLTNLKKGEFKPETNAKINKPMQVHSNMNSN